MEKVLYNLGNIVSITEYILVSTSIMTRGGKGRGGKRDIYMYNSYVLCTVQIRLYVVNFLNSARAGKYHADFFYLNHLFYPNQNYYFLFEPGKMFIQSINKYNIFYLYFYNF